MKIYHTIPENNNLFRNPVVTIGNFDGVHAGHKKIFDTLVRTAIVKNGDPLVITFSNHPRKILYPDIPIKVITTVEEKLNAIFNCGVSNIILLHFTREMAEMHAYDFFNDILIKKIDAREIVIGYDHAFGKNREGDINFLSKLAGEKGIGLTKVDEELLADRPISSSWLREEILEGNIVMANRLLGRIYSISGFVKGGHGRGKKLGFPTANIVPDSEDKIVPKDGVYAVMVKVADTMRGGMLNIGCNPTFADKQRTLEVNIFDFDRDIYDEQITVYFHQRIRDEVTFESADALVRQIEADRIEAVRALHLDSL